MRSTTRASVLLLSGMLACSRAPEARQAPVQASPDAAPGDGVDDAACGGRTGCEVVRRLVAHRDADGRQQVVAVVRLPERAPTDSDHVLLYSDWHLGPETCVPSETWLVTSEPHGASRGQILARECSMDSSGQPPSLEVLANGEVRSSVLRRVEYVEPPSSSTFSEATEVTDFVLDPLHRVRTLRRDGEHMRAVDHGYFSQESEWEWDAFGGRTCWDGDECSPLLPVAAIADDGAFQAGTWKSTRLGGCSMRVDGESASVRLLSLGGQKLILEVQDDAFVTRGVMVDAIEVASLWEDATPYSRTWKQRLTMDGTFTDWNGETRHLEVAEDGPNVRRFLVSGVWPPDHRFWWLSYADTDDGQSVRERLTPVPLSNTHGQAVSNLDPQPRCTVRDHELVPLPATGPL